MSSIICCTLTDRIGVVLASKPKDKKKINFFGKECQTTPKPQKQCNADDAENVGTQQQQRTRPPEHRHAAKGLNARALYGFGPGVADQAAPLPRPPPANWRTEGKSKT